MIFCANTPAIKGVVTNGSPLVTTRRSSASTSPYVELAQVMASSDVFANPSSPPAVQRGPSDAPCNADPNKRCNGVPPSLGQVLQSMESSSDRKPPRCQEPRAAVASNETTARNGSGVPESLVALVTLRRCETDRNTYLTLLDTG